MSEATVGPLCRVGYHAAPLAFTPLDMSAFNHRFDDTPELRRLPADDIPALPVTAAWRRRSVLAPAVLRLDGDLFYLESTRSSCLGLRDPWVGGPLGFARSGSVAERVVPIGQQR